MIASQPYELRPFIRRCIAGAALSSAETEALVAAMTDGATTPAQTAALLVALAAKGESLEEIVGAARALQARAKSIPVALRPELDVCGTGGDGSGTFNISTAVAFVVAGAGVSVAKHGNRAVHGQCGSADVMQALGVRIDASPEKSAAGLERDGVAFLFAQAYHPAMRRVAALRSEIGVRTVFNLVGPLINPARPKRQLVGIAERAAMKTMARALAAQGCERAAVVRSDDGMDEVSVCSPTRVIEWTGKGFSEYTIEPEAWGLRKAPVEALAGGGADANARILCDVLEGQPGPRRDVVLLNAALGLTLAGRSAGLAEGLAIAAASIDSGAARAKLDALVEATNR